MRLAAQVLFSKVIQNVAMGGFVTVGTDVHIVASVHLGNRMFVGAGAQIVNGAVNSSIQTGNNTMIGAGSCVL